MALQARSGVCRMLRMQRGTGDAGCTRSPKPSTRMIRLNNILVPWDFSPFSERALAYARGLARRSGAVLHVLHAEVLHGDHGGRAAYSGRAARERLAKLAGLEGDVPVPEGSGEGVPLQHAVVRDLAAAPAILAYAQEHDVDLIVMGTHGRRGVRRLLLGSVAAEVIRLAICPVLTVREGTVDGGEALLVPIDFSTHARKALSEAKALAALYDAPLTLLHVVEERLHPAFYNMGAFSIVDLQPDLEARAMEHLKKFYEEAEGLSGAVQYAVCVGHAPGEIVRYAEEHPPRLIMMSTHGLTGLKHFFMGSVAEKVARGAPCPVLTVKAFGKSLVGPERTAATPEAV